MSRPIKFSLLEMMSFLLHSDVTICLTNASPTPAIGRGGGGIAVDANARGNIVGHLILR